MMEFEKVLSFDVASMTLHRCSLSDEVRLPSSAPIIHVCWSTRITEMSVSLQKVAEPGQQPVCSWAWRTYCCCIKILRHIHVEIQRVSIASWQ